MPKPPSDATEALFSRLMRGTRLRNLQVVALAAELGSLQKVAQALRISQPAATKAIADFEAQLGIPLFERHARGMRVAPAGRELLPLLRRLIDDTRRCAERAVQQRLGASASLRLASVAAGVSGVLAAGLGEFARRHADICVDVLDVDIFSLSALIAEDGADLFVCRHPGEVPQGYVFEALVDDAHVLVVPITHALARMNSLTLDDLARFEWLLPPSGIPARQIFEELWAASGAAAPNVCKVSTRSPLLIAELVNQLELIALVPFTIARPSLEAGTLTELRFPGLRGLGPMGLLWRGPEASEAAQHLVATLRRTAGKMAQHPSQAT
ncbi:LysR family transcriptional regulator [Thiomonas sp. FB-6]|uniref:LysR family transcriptional regulator n=1 Tax=Thiomonas sp. FB-6 TaxID=1158291 RepID=UPI000368A02B|nr:LysR family transcriptional regulator [Thiomonas sp. FB-6]